MTSTIDDDGRVQAVTLLQVSDHTVIQKKTTETDGYNAVQVGAESVKKLSKSIAGHVKKSAAQPKIIKEIRIKDEENELNVGDKFSTDVFSVGDTVDVTGTSKGKGWAGTIKRHNFHRGRKTHGGRSYRRVGSIGSMYPQHILKGKKMSGRMGGEQVTIKGLNVSIVDTELKVIGVTGAVPGPRKSLVIVKGVSK
jgi:large subunit ribosomal protein L3